MYYYVNVFIDIPVKDERKAFDEGCEAIEKSMADGWKIMAVIDVPFRPLTRIYEICAPKHAKKALDREMRLLPLMPCKFVCWIENSRLKIGYLKPTAVFGKMVGDAGDLEEIKDVPVESEKDIQKMAENIVGKLNQ